MVGTVDKWQVSFTFTEPDIGLVSRIEVKRSTMMDGEYGVVGSVSDFLDWRSEQGLRFPGRVVTWELRVNQEAEFDSVRLESTLEHVSEPTTLEASFGDLFADIPDGTAVTVTDQPGIDFVWQQGEIVPKVDTARVESLTGHIFAPAASIWRFWPMWLGAVIATIVAGSVVYRYIRR